MARFLAQLAQPWPDAQLGLVMDHVSDHWSPPVRTWWAAQAGRIPPFWLPVSTPHLNLMERVGRFLKPKLAGHPCWADVAGLARAAATLLDQLEAHFHRDEPPRGRLVSNFCEAA